MTPSEIIAVTFGCIGCGKIIFDFVVRKEERHQDHDSRLEGRVTQLISDFSAHQAEDRTELKWIKEGITDLRQDVSRCEGKIESVQAQIRFVATGGNNKAVQLGGE